MGLVKILSLLYLQSRTRKEKNHFQSTHLTLTTLIGIVISPILKMGKLKIKEVK